MSLVTGLFPKRSALLSQSVIALALALLALAPGAHAAKLHGILPPANPPANIAPDPNFADCNEQGSCVNGPPCYSANGAAPQFSSPGCQSGELAAINAARAKEGVAAMVLPSNFNSLSSDDQLLVVIDLERVGRGLAPFAGIVAKLDSVAQKGTAPAGAPAGSFEDPSFPRGFTVAAGTAFAWRCAASACGGSGEPGASIAAGGQINPLEADYDWMYDDGYGSANYACKTPGSRGCWGHRDNILGRYPARSAFSSPSWGAPLQRGSVRRTTLVMGAGSLEPNGDGGTQGNWTAIFAAIVGPRPAFVYTWSQALAAGAHGS